MRNNNICGAKARTRNWEPCRGPAMANGRCRMHSGGSSKKTIHGRAARRIKKQRKKESMFLREMQAVSLSLYELMEKQNDTAKNV